MVSDILIPNKLGLVQADDDAKLGLLTSICTSDGTWSESCLSWTPMAIKYADLSYSGTCQILVDQKKRFKTINMQVIKSR